MTGHGFGYGDVGPLDPQTRQTLIAHELAWSFAADSGELPPLVRLGLTQVHLGNVAAGAQVLQEAGRHPDARYRPEIFNGAVRADAMYWAGAGRPALGHNSLQHIRSGERAEYIALTAHVAGAVAMAAGDVVSAYGFLSAANSGWQRADGAMPALLKRDEVLRQAVQLNAPYLQSAEHALQRDGGTVSQAVVVEPAAPLASGAATGII